MLLTQKYRPKLADIPHDTKPLVDFVVNHKKQKKRAILLHGPSGVGKTAAVYALAQHHGLELVEVNASDFRNADEINSKIGQALKQQSLFNSGKLILVDELDGIAGNEDRGGIAALADLVARAAFPVILVANDAWAQKLNPLRSKSVLVEFSPVASASLVKILQGVFAAENIAVDESVLKTLARRSGGDLRGALIDAQCLSAVGVSAKAVESLHERHQTESIMQALVKILKSTDPQLALSALDLVDEDLDECLLWIEENLPKEYSGPDLARAFDCLSRADVFRGRISRWQYWRFLVYVSALISAGVAVAKDKKSSLFVQYGRTQRLLKLWMARQKYARRKSVAEKLGRLSHCSVRKALDGVLYFQGLFERGLPVSSAIAEELGLEEEEVAWLAGKAVRSARVE
ncbi:replication factor C large subunit [Candidatus Woesearchaeota archaeon]|nr:replication factor C large subunit [Candidatus Woesearchaeota archaeon]